MGVVEELQDNLTVAPGGARLCLQLQTNQQWKKSRLFKQSIATVFPRFRFGTIKTFQDLDLEGSKHFKTIECDKRLHFGCQLRKRLIRKQVLRQLLQLLQEIKKEHYSVT